MFCFFFFILVLLIVPKHLCKDKSASAFFLTKIYLTINNQTIRELFMLQGWFMVQGYLNSKINNGCLSKTTQTNLTFPRFHNATSSIRDQFASNNRTTHKKYQCTINCLQSLQFLAKQKSCKQTKLKQNSYKNFWHIRQFRSMKKKKQKA